MTYVEESNNYQFDSNTVECCPLVADPLTFLFVLGIIAVATMLLYVEIIFTFPLPPDRVKKRSQRSYAISFNLKGSTFLD